MRNKFSVLLVTVGLMYTHVTNAELKGIWLPDCDKIDISSSSKPPMLVMITLYYNEYY